MKKIISLLLVLSVLLSLSPAVFSETVDTNNESIGLLNALGISKEQNPELKITRADFSSMLTKVIGFEADVTPVFSDVSDTYYASKAIYTLYNMKLINGKGQGRFFPEDEILIEEAITVMLRFLGYDELAYYQGGYPTGYTFVASDINLTKGISYKIGEVLTLKKCAKLFENLLDISIFSIVMVSDDGTVYRQASDDKTVAKVYLKMDIVSDIVTANRHTSLYTPLDSTENSIVLGNTKYKSNNFNSDSYLGYSVKAYIDDYTNEVIYLKKTEKNKVVTFDAKDIFDISNNRIYYNDGNDYEEYPSEASIIYNKKAITNYKDSYLDIKKGSVELIDNNNDGDFDVVNIISYKNYVVDSVSGDATVVRLKDNQGVIGLENKYKTYKIFDEDGVENPVEMLSSNYVLTVIENADNGYIEITYLEEYINGTVTGILTDDTSIMYIDNEPYEMSDYFIKNQPENIKTGLSGMFFLDIFGEIVSYMPMGDTNRGFAFLLNIAEKERESEEISVKLFTQNNETRLLESGKYITLDGKRMTAIDALPIIKPSSTFTPELIYYELNSKGMITAIDTVKDNEKDETQLKLLHDSETTEEIFRSASMTFDIDGCKNSVYVGDSCVVFTTPEVLSTNGDDYSAIPCADLPNNTTLPYKAYARNEDGVEADAIVLGELKNITFDAYSYVCVIEKITETVNEEGDRMHKVVYWYRGKSYEKYTVDDKLFASVNPGDVLYIATDLEDKISNFHHLFDLKQQKVNKDDLDVYKDRERKDSHRFVFGYGYDVINSNLFKMSLVTPSPDVDEKTEIEFHRFGNYMYNVIEMPGGNVKVSVGTINDIKDYESFGSNYSKIFVHQTYMTDYDIVVYNRQ
ncbi:MAG: hypothetical protein E7419_03225 [Ruminococcaceae bacterium]|nr:hypothetical protein [Oscillospiraceae bacterium]